MSKVSKIISDKFIDSIEIDDLEVWTDTGWEDISHIHQTIEFEEYEVTLEDGKSLVVADTHILFDDSLNEVFVQDLVVGSMIMTEDGPKRVSEIFKNGLSSNMFDLTVASNNHRFYTNGILSHNSTIVAGYILHYVLFNKEKQVGILANKAATSREILSRIKRMFEHLPKWMQQGVTEYSKGYVSFENMSSIVAAATSSDSIRGLSLHLIYLDEFAHVEGQLEFWESTYPVISSGESSKVIITSTPNGMDLFHKIYSEAEQGINDFVPIRVHWSEHPKRDEAWKEQTLKNIGYEQFKQEFECVSGDTMIELLNTDTNEILKLTILEAYHLLETLDL